MIVPIGRAGLAAIGAGKLAWSTLGALRVRHCGATAVEALVSAKLVERWEVPGGRAPQTRGGRRRDWRAVTLTPLAAEQLGLKLTQLGDGDRPRWVPVDEDEGPDRMAPDHMGRTVVGRLKLPESIADTAPGPDILRDADGAPVLLFGREVPRDPKMKKPRVQ